MATTNKTAVTFSKQWILRADNGELSAPYFSSVPSPAAGPELTVPFFSFTALSTHVKHAEGRGSQQKRSLDDTDGFGSASDDVFVGRREIGSPKPVEAVKEAKRV